MKCAPIFVKYSVLFFEKVRSKPSLKIPIANAFAISRIAEYSIEYITNINTILYYLCNCTRARYGIKTMLLTVINNNNNTLPADV